MTPGHTYTPRSIPLIQHLGAAEGGVPEVRRGRRARGGETVEGVAAGHREGEQTRTLVGSM